jgi:hypothetical protein
MEFPQLLVRGRARQLSLSHTPSFVFSNPILEDNICSQYFHNFILHQNLTQKGIV